MAGEPLIESAQSRPLFGRDRELEELSAGLARARAGRGSLFLVTGMPGIGKTRLAEALGERAGAEGMLVVWGRCWENPGAPAYYPWAQALRALIERRDDAALQDELGRSADWIAQIIPELRHRLSGIEQIAPLRSEQARFALFDAVSSFLRSVTATDPLVVVLDDLHAGDAESLALLNFVVHSLSEAPVVVVGAYQEIAARARPELAKPLGQLARSGTQIALVGVAEEHVGSIVEGQLGTVPPPEFVRAVYATTEGNPFFAREVTRLLGSKGQLAIPPEGEASARFPLPDTVRETIRRRFEPLSPEAIETLKVAAVIGREFRLGTLERVGGDPEVLIRQLDEAEAAALVTSTSGGIGRFCFTHALIGETLYAELGTAERVQLHGEVGEALHAVYGDDSEHLAELAHHFLEAAPGGNAARALDYAARAGREAMRVLAYERAAGLFRLALDVEQQLPFDAARHAELTLALGSALTRAGDPSARDVLLRAATAARSVERPNLFAEAALGIHAFNLTPGVPDDAAISLLEEALERVGPDDSAPRARLLARLAMAMYYRFGTAERRNALVTEAVAMARRLGDPATLAYVLANGQVATWGPDTTERDLEWVDELLVLTEEAGNVELALQTRTRQIDYLLELDDLVGADIAIEALERIAADCPDPRGHAYVPLQRARRAALAGDHAEAERCNAEAAAVGDALEDRVVRFLAVAQLSMLRWNQGRIGEVEDLVRRFADAMPAVVGWRAALTRIHCALGREAEARRELERLDQDGLAELPRYNGWLNMMALLAEVCVHLDDAARATAIYRLLLPFERRNVVTAQCCFDGPVSRFLGILASTSREWEAAERHFESALRACERLDAKPFGALARIDEAEMLVARNHAGDAARAQTLLTEAAEIASSLGMEGIVERAERIRLRLGDVAPGAGAGDVTARAAAPATAAEMRREGEMWAFSFDRSSIRIRDARGVRYLAALLSRPGEEIHCLELAGSSPVPDAKSEAEYRQRRDDLREELDEAESFNDPERAARAREALESLVSEMTSALGGDALERKAGSDVERARVAVTKAIRSTMRRIDEIDSNLGGELTTTIRTGTFCCYEPDRRRPVVWHVQP